MGYLLDFLYFMLSDFSSAPVGFNEILGNHFYSFFRQGAKTFIKLAHWWLRDIWGKKVGWLTDLIYLGGVKLIWFVVWCLVLIAGLRVLQIIGASVLYSGLLEGWFIYDCRLSEGVWLRRGTWNVPHVLIALIHFAGFKNYNFQIN